MPKDLKKDLFGFTLIEVTISLGIISLIVAGGVFVYLTVIQAANRSTAASQVEDVANLLMETMVREVRSSRCVSKTDEILQIRNSSCDAVEITYSLQDDNLVRNAGGVEESLNPASVKVDALTFEPETIDYNTKTIKVTLSVSTKNAPRSDYSSAVTLEQAVTLRSY